MDDLAYQIEQLTKDLPLPCFFGFFVVMVIVVGFGAWLCKKNYKDKDKKKKSKENDNG